MKQPKINIPKTRFETFLDAVGIISYITLIVYLLAQYGALPDSVPGHYNAAGEVDRWGSKTELFILPIVAAVLWVPMTILEKYPHTYNYLNLREDNFEAQYKNGKLMMNVLKNEIVLLFSWITYQNIRVAIGESEGLGAAFLPVFLAVIFGSLFIFMFRMLRN